MPKFKSLEERTIALLKRSHNIEFGHILYKELFNFYIEFKNADTRVITEFIKYNHPSLSIKDRYIKYKCLGKGVKLEKYLLKYGDDIGAEKWEHYRYLQKYTNSLEYKSEKHGMSIGEYESYNKSRAVTLNNMTKKYGEIEGKERFDNYCKRQSYTNSLEYCIEKYGTENGQLEFNRINSEKALTLSNFVRKYGELKGKENYEKWIQHAFSFYSKGSQELFNEIEKLLLDNSIESKTYYATKNKEFGLMKGNTYVKYDFVDTLNKFCIEYNGDIYHANPKRYLPNEIPKGRGNKLSAKEIWEKDKIKQKLLLDLGYKIIIVWESDYNNNKKLMIEKIYDELYRK